MNVLAIDVGTSSVKAAVLDQQAAAPVAGVARAECGLDRPQSDAAEIDPARLWGAIDAAAGRAVRALPRSAEPPSGVGLTALAPALVLLDRADLPLAPVYTHLDRRSRPAASRAWAELGGEFLQDTGNRPLPGGTSAVVFAHLVGQAPDVRNRVHRYLHVNGWVALRLTGVAAMDPANASFTGLFGTCTDRRWSDRWCRYFGVDPAWLPDVADGRAVVGGLRREVATAWGVRPGIPVRLGTIDTSSAILAAGMTSGDLMHAVGTTQVLAVLTAAPAPSPDRLTRLHGVGPLYVQAAHNPVGGIGLEWMHGLCFRDQPAAEFYGATVGSAARAGAGTVRLSPPYLGGDRLEIEPRDAGFTGLSPGTTRDEMLAAVLAAMRAGHEAAAAAIGWAGPGPGRRVFLTGGGCEVVARLLPGYGGPDVHRLGEGSLLGIARLFGP